MENKEIEKGIIETYSSIISVLRTLPGMRMEDVFSATPIKELEDEKSYLESVFNKIKE